MPVQTNPVEAVTEKKDQRPWALRSLPPFPPVAMQVLGLLDNPEAPLQKVADLLRIDPALSAELLRVANSALYGFAGRIDTINRALVVLGAENVKRLALTVSLGKFSQGFLRDQSLRVCWDHSLASAVVAEELASDCRLAKDRAYTAGILHDVGRLALLACYPAEYGNLMAVAREQNFDQLECERELFDIDHCAAGQWLADHWNLPTPFAEAIARHHAPADAYPEPGELTPLVRAACQVADLFGYAVIEAPQERPLTDILAPLRLANPDQVGARLYGTRERVQQAVDAFAGGVRRQP